MIPQLLSLGVLGPVLALQARMLLATPISIPLLLWGAFSIDKRVDVPLEQTSPGPKGRSYLEVRFVPEGPDPCRAPSDVDYEVTLKVDRIPNPPWSAFHSRSRSARIVPSFRKGKAIGFKLFSIRPSSAFAIVGLQNGDVIRSVCSFPLASPDRALEAYRLFKDARDLWFEFERKGESHRVRLVLL